MKTGLEFRVKLNRVNELWIRIFLSIQGWNRYYEQLLFFSVRFYQPIFHLWFSFFRLQEPKYQGYYVISNINLLTEVLRNKATPSYQVASSNVPLIWHMGHIFWFDPFPSLKYLAVEFHQSLGYGIWNQLYFVQARLTNYEDRILDYPEDIWVSKHIHIAEKLLSSDWLTNPITLFCRNRQIFWITSYPPLSW